MQDFKFASIKDKKDEKIVTFKKAYRNGLTDITISLATLVEEEGEDFESLLASLKTQAINDFRKSLPSPLA